MRDPEYAWSRRAKRVAHEPRRVAAWARWYATKQARELNHELFLDPNHDVASTAFVVGSARSGTTWLAEVLSADHDTRFIMEPFDDRCSQFRGGMLDATYLAPHAQNDRLGFFADKVFTGQLRSQWTDQFNHAHRPARRVVKDVRTVALLGWIAARYPAMPIIYVVRHPFATAFSMATLGWGAHGDLLHPTDRLDALSTDERRLLLRQAFLAEVSRWCVEQSRGLRHPDPAIAVCFYEQLVADPVAEFARLGDYLASRSPAWAGWAPSPSSFAKPSQTSVRRQAAGTVAGWVETWQGELDQATVDEAQQIVASFGLGSIYGTSPEPQCAPARIWQGVAR